jgi:hypothetical protein
VTFIVPRRTALQYDGTNAAELLALIQNAAEEWSVESQAGGILTIVQTWDDQYGHQVVPFALEVGDWMSLKLAFGQAPEVFAISAASYAEHWAVIVPA